MKCTLRFSPLVIVLNALIATSLPQNLFLTDDTLQPELLILTNANLNYDPSDSNDFTLASSLGSDDTDLFSIPSEDGLGLGHPLASTQSQGDCKADSDLTNILQARGTGTSICGPQKNDAPLNLPLNLFNDPTEFLRGNLPPQKSNSQDEIRNDNLYRSFFGADEEVSDESEMLVGRCIFPFIHNVCCEGPVGSIKDGIISRISNCDVGIALCDSPYEACCFYYVSGASF